MIGFHDHVYRQGSGRPEPHRLWAAECFATWTGWFMAAVSFIGAVCYYLEWREADGALSMLLGGVLLAMIAYLRCRAMYRKRASLREAVNRYEKMLSEALP